jgi:hypothetical protein
MHEMSGDGKEFGERAGVRESGLRIVRAAQVGPAFTAAGAVTAGAEALGNDDVPFVDVPDARPDRRDGSSPFVPGDDRVPHEARRAPAFKDLDV